MKQFTIFYYLFFIGIALTSCNNDFLQIEKKIGKPVADTIFITRLEKQKAVNFNLPTAGNAHWRVYKFPVMMEISPKEGNFSKGKSSFEIQVIGQYDFINEAYKLPLTFEVEGIGLVDYPFQLIPF